MPQRVVLDGGHGVAAQEPGKTCQALADDRITLVRHGRRTFLSGREILLRLTYFRPLQMSDLDADLLEEGTDQRQRRQVLRMAVPLDHLRGYRCGAQAQLLADVDFDLGGQVLKRAYGTGDHPYGDHLEGTVHAFDGADAFLVPKGELQTERRGFGMDTMGAADTGRVLELVGAPCEHITQRYQVGPQQLTGLLQLDGQAGIQDVAGRHTKVDVA